MIFTISGNPVKFHTGQLQQRTHDGVVLHGTDDAVTAGFQKPFDHHVESCGGAGGQNDMGRGFREMEEPSDGFPQKQGGETGILRSAVYTSVDGGTDGVHIVFHAVTDAFRFRIGSGSIVQISCSHEYPSFLWSIS